MTTIYADFNALTEDHSISMTTLGSRQDLGNFDVRLGDWVWLSDGEMQVGAQIIEDDRHELVAVPEWDTAVDFHFGEVDLDYLTRTYKEFQRLIKLTNGRSPDVERKILELAFQFERAAPPEILNFGAGIYAFRRAMALYHLGKYELALIEIESALASRPDAPNFSFLFLDLLRRTNPPRAVVEAERLASTPDAAVAILAAAINILASHAEDLPDEGFVPIARRTLEFCELFERSPQRGQTSVSLLSLIHFNRGMILLRLGQTESAHAALEFAHALDPINLTLDEATRLVAYDQRAREVAARVREKPLAA